MNLISANERASRQQISHQVNNGEFWKPCPGTTAGYLCCGYQILTPQTGCGMYCRYCVLQSYLENPGQTVYENLDTLQEELARKMAVWKGVSRRDAALCVIRFGTGEFADSLFLEKETHCAESVAHLLEPYPNACVEFKSKSVNARECSGIRNKHQVVMGFSMNTPRMIAACEEGTATLEDRLSTAQWCIEQGFWVAFHFDPMIWYPEWEEEYRTVVRRIFKVVSDPSRIAWWSVGGFRCMPNLRKVVREQNAEMPLFGGEMILGDDKKLRYFRPIRVAFYAAMVNEIEKVYPAVPLYLCMESPEVWEESGLAKRIPNGLADYLDTRAQEMLKIPCPTPIRTSLNQEYRE